MNGPPYDVFDPNKYTKAYLEEEDPQTGKKKYERCDLFNKQPLKKTEKEEKDKNYIAYYSSLFWDDFETEQKKLETNS